MMNLDAQTVASVLPYDQLIEALRDAFRRDMTVPSRIHHEIAVPGEAPGTLLLMPAWRSGAYIGVKIVSVFPGNAARDIPAVSGSYLLLSRVFTTGQIE